MKKEKQQLAVEWLETRAEERESNNPNESAYWHLRELIKDFEQAKEMEKEQSQKYHDIKEVLEDIIQHLDEGRVLTLRKDSVIVEALRNSINN